MAKMLTPLLYSALDYDNKTQRSVLKTSKIVETGNVWHFHTRLFMTPGEIYTGFISVDFEDKMDHEKPVIFAINQIWI